MTKHEVALVVPILAMALVAPPTHAQQPGPPPPVAARHPHTTEIHGYTLKDDYFWLRDKANPEVITYLERENAYTEERDAADQGAAGDALQRDARAASSRPT